MYCGWRSVTKQYEDNGGHKEFPENRQRCAEPKLELRTWITCCNSRGELNGGGHETPDPMRPCHKTVIKNNLKKS